MTLKLLQVTLIAVLFYKTGSKRAGGSLEIKRPLLMDNHIARRAAGALLTFRLQRLSSKSFQASSSSFIEDP